MLETSAATVQRVRERFYEGGFEAALERSLPDRVYKRSLDGRAEARLIALVHAPNLPEGAQSLVFEASGGQGGRAGHRRGGLARDGA
jgi:hypothetical protein